MDIYIDSKEFTGIPKAGRYTVRAPENFPQEAFGATKAGYLSVAVDPTIVGPTNEGFPIRFTKVSAKTWNRGGVRVSQLGDYLRACGRRANVSADPQAQADAVEQTANSIYQIDADWRAYCKEDGFQVEGMDRFPSDGNGGKLPYFAHPTLKAKDPTTGETIKVVDAKTGNEIEQPLMLRANLVVTRYVSAV